MLGQSSPVEKFNVMRPAMQSSLAPAGSSISSAIAFHEDDVGRPNEVDAKLGRVLDRPVSS